MCYRPAKCIIWNNYSAIRISYIIIITAKPVFIISTPWCNLLHYPWIHKTKSSLWNGISYSEKIKEIQRWQVRHKRPCSLFSQQGQSRWLWTKCKSAADCFVGSKTQIALLCYKHPNQQQLQTPISKNKLLCCKHSIQILCRNIYSTA